LLVLLHSRLSGLSPFAGNDDYETLGKREKVRLGLRSGRFRQRVRRGAGLHQEPASQTPEKRLTVHEALDHPWLQRAAEGLDKRIPASRYDKLRQKMQDLHMHETSFDRREAVPRFVLRSKNAYCLEGQNAVFECKVLSISPPIVTWARNDEALMQSVKYMQRYAGHDFSLKINRVKPEDGGDYQEATIKLHVEPMAPKDNLEPAERTPRPRKSPSPLPELWKEPDRPAKEGGFVKLSCTFDGLPPPEVFWTKDGRELQPRGKDYNLQVVSGVASLEIFLRQHAGLRPLFGPGEDETQCKLDVCESRVKSAGSGGSGVRFKESMSASTGSARPTRDRSAGGAGGGSSTIVEEKYSLEFESTSTSSTSRTEMRSSTSATSVSRASERSSRQKQTEISTSSASEAPKAAPEVTKKLPAALTAKEGDRVELSCTFNAAADDIGIAWDLDGKPAQAEEGALEIRTLLLPDALVEDSGLYTCTARQVGASAKTSCRLTVEAPKAQAAQVKIDAHRASLSVKDGEPFELALKASGGVTAVRWTANGKPVSADFEQVSDPASGAFLLKSVEALFPDDSGQYRAELLAADSAVAAVAQCSVRVAPPPDEPDAPSELLETFPESATVQAGAAVTVACKAKLPGL
uniref:Ig-like domain-containing protein n=1 Tax=Macrostomum lignano TaxID=282301 RepID=A0A1I8F5E4_9PLAT